ILPRLGFRANELPARSCRAGPCAFGWRQGGASLPARRYVRKAPPVNAAMGDVLHHRARARDGEHRDAAAAQRLTWRPFLLSYRIAGIAPETVEKCGSAWPVARGRYCAISARRGYFGARCSRPIMKIGG